MGISPCNPIPVTPGIVAFDPVAFSEAYPCFSSVSAAALTENFNSATLMLDNSCCSVIQDAPTRSQFLNLATAHITALLNGVNGQPPQGIVGRINNATQGSVSVQAEMLTKTESAAWWQQTQWGAMFWAATLKYRTARYVPPCSGFPIFPGPNGPGTWDACSDGWPS